MVVGLAKKILKRVWLLPYQILAHKLAAQDWLEKSSKNELRASIRARANQILDAIQTTRLAMINCRYLAWPMRALIQTRP
jgi:hypothetical protein